MTSTVKPASTERAVPGFVTRRPEWFAVRLSLFFVLPQVASWLLGPQRATSLTAHPALFAGIAWMVVVPAATLTMLGWWGTAGFTSRSTWRSLVPFWPLVLLFVVAPAPARPLLSGASSNSLGYVTLVVLNALAVGFGYEATFRGVVLQTLLPRGTMRAVIISSVLCGAAYLGTTAPGVHPAIVGAQALNMVGMGVAFAAVVVVTGTIWPPVLIDAVMQVPFFFTPGANTPGRVDLIVTIVIELLIGALAAGYGIWLLHQHHHEHVDPSDWVWPVSRSARVNFVRESSGACRSASGLVQRSRLAVLVTALVVAGVVAGCASTQPARSPARDVAEQLGSGFSSVIVLVSDHGHSTVATAGTRHPVAAQRFRVGTVTKAFTATLVLQLVDQKRIGLDDPVALYLPGVLPTDGTITIRDLLEHRSGLVNFTDYHAWLREAVQSPSIRPIDALRFAASRPLLFKPGSKRGYSNTNYLALGLVIEKVTGHSFEQELQDRILEPLALDHTELATTARLPDLPDQVDKPELYAAAGGIVSNAQDLARFFTTLLSGRLLSPTSLAQMIPSAPNRHGMGLSAGTLPCGRIYASYGTISSNRTFVLASGDGARIAVVSVRGRDRNRSKPKITEAPDPSPLICPNSSRSAG